MVRGGGAIGTRGGDRRESLHDHDARRFHRCHRCVPAHELTLRAKSPRRWARGWQTSPVPSAQWRAGTARQTQNSFPPGSAITESGDKNGKGHAASATRSGAWCVVLGCTPARGQPPPVPARSDRLVLRPEPPGDPQRACSGPGRRCLPACRRAWRRSHRRRAPPPPNGPDRPRSLAPSPRSLVQARCQLAEMLPAPGHHDQVPVSLQTDIDTVTCGLAR
jgi:hypothetical protein